MNTFFFDTGIFRSIFAILSKKFFAIQHIWIEMELIVVSQNHVCSKY